MITKEINDSLRHAYRDLLNAEIELNRPQEDVVTLSACNAVRNSMKQMMQLYLAALLIPAKENPSLAELLDQCVKANQSFDKIDLGNIECKGIDHAHCDGRYCLSVDNVSDCLTAANQLKTLVWKEFKVTE
jgi:hypothetical protein